MRDNPYYSLRTGKNPKKRLDLPALKKLFLADYDDLVDHGYFQEHFGIHCSDDFLPGLLGERIDTAILFALRKDDLWPIHSRFDGYSEDDLFDMIEFLFDHVSEPLEGRYHGYNDCGMHYDSFDQPGGQALFRDRVNRLLAEYSDGFELSTSGEILHLPESGMATLAQASLPPLDDANISARVDAAKARYWRHKSSLDDRRQAVRDLADVLEFLRSQMKNVLTKPDEADLFNLANNFGIRHHRADQKTDYDKPIWYSWLFYYYLATIHACVRLIEKTKTADHPSGGEGGA